jgi:hypothetical protein
MALLTIRDLSVAFETHDGVVRAGNDVSFLFEAGKVLALLGESGSGKSVTLRAILGLHPALRTRVTGEVLVNGRDVNRLDEHACEQLRSDLVSIVLQEPMTARDPSTRSASRSPRRWPITATPHTPRGERASVRVWGLTSWGRGPTSGGARAEGLPVDYALRMTCRVLSVRCPGPRQ